MPKGDIKEAQENSKLLPAESIGQKDYICKLENDKVYQAKLANGNKAYGKLKVVVIICFFLMIVEIGGGIWSDSLAILTDAAHMLSDVAGFGVSMISIKVAQKRPNKTMTFGY